MSKFGTYIVMPVKGIKQVFETMTYTKKNEEAVSPVIGVILMVAVTVILAAVIAAFVFGMAGNLQKSKVVAATAYKSGTTTINVVYQGGQDNSDVTTITGLVNGVTGGTLTKGQVGGQIHLTGTLGSKKDHVVATALFSDGTTQVILDTYV